MQKLLTKIFGTQHERETKRLQPQVEAINRLEPEMQRLSDAELAERFGKFREQVQARLKDVIEEERKAIEEAAGDATARQVQKEAAEKQRRKAEEAALEEVLAPVFALVREVGRRTVAMRNFDVQLMGGMVLHEGKIAEMKTGEGKTLVATLPACLNALLGRGVHIVTVNDYLAKRDAEWMGPVYKSLGLEVGVIVHEKSDEERKAAYRADITYGTNNEFGFDYLRDNMKFEQGDRVQRPHHFAIVDEVDSILIDEARTPLIISGPSEESTDKYYRIDRIIPRLEKEKHYTVDEKHRSAALTEEGVEHLESLLKVENLYDPVHLETLHHVNQALKAHTVFKRDVDYMVKDGEVLIVDEFTGRLMPGRRWSDGLHQAIEAKEGVKIERENQTLATITFQNYFRMYKKLAGMTGTAETEAPEFAKIYKLDVSVIPTNQPLVRHQYPDMVYRTEREKYNAVVEEIKELHQKGQPVLVGTISIENSERLSALLKKAGLPHEVLNAKQHEREAFIVAQAGRKNTVTLSTNMAGRGTDIVLGGNPEFMAKDHLLTHGQAEALPAGEERYGSDEQYVYFYNQGQFFRVAKVKWAETFARLKEQTAREHDEVVAVGGLHILGTERHESRRIDNQLRGRAGRQGDPGSSRFFLSLEDDLMRIFGGERLKGLMLKLGMEEGVPIESRLISKRIEAAQKAVEGQNFEARKHLLEYDDVMNKQRVAIYGMRREILEGADLKEEVLSMAGDFASHFLDLHCPKTAHPEKWDVDGLRQELWRQFGLDLRSDGLDPLQLNQEELEAALEEKLKALYAEKEQELGAEQLRRLERIIRLQIIDTQWKDHLLAMDHLKEGINLRGYGQKDPLLEYKRESFTMFEEMLDRVDSETLRYLYLMKPVAQDAGEEERLFERRRRQQARDLRFVGAGDAAPAKPQTVRVGKKVGRNEPCPCGSGKKYKKCHGAAA
ncbi:MAG: preprotein translocase subunit SecA [Candidatus Acidiferrales bacterium]